jgi:NAD(P)H-hydrate epimerase
MKLVTAAQMKEIDKTAILKYKIPSLTLMEKAGKKLAEAARDLALNKNMENILVFCGKGNNGGDGLVAARYLKKQRLNVQIFIFGKKNELSPDAAANLKRIKSSANPVDNKVVKIVFEPELKLIENELNKYPLVIDALLGTGIKGKLNQRFIQIIKLINKKASCVVAADIPSGLDADIGKPLGEAIKADITVTIGLPKKGFIGEGYNYTGKIVVADIGIPYQIMNNLNDAKKFLVSKDIKNILPRRRRGIHKGENGHTFIVAGSTGLTGAAILASLGALKSGSGLVTLGLPKSLNHIAEIKLTEVMSLPLPETVSAALSRKAKAEILNFIKKANAVVMGPGLSVNKQTTALIRTLIPLIKNPLVLDADALNALAGKTELLKKRKEFTIITPHPGEMSRLINKPKKDITKNIISITKEFSVSHNVITVLKTAQTVISDVNGKIFINSTGNPGMASGGMGDVLSGMIGSFISQGMAPIEACKAGVYLHGLAADLLAEKIGEIGITASQVAENIPRAIKETTYEHG